MKLTVDHTCDIAEPTQDVGVGALRTSRGNLPLRAIDVQATITGMSAGVTVTQQFMNPFDVPLEATYIFPLPDRGAVTALRMEADGRVVDGVLAERSQARRDYETAIRAGKRAALAEEDRPNVFTMMVGNIVPGEEVRVTLSLCQPLLYEDGEFTFRFPLVVAPRYIPGCPLPGAPAGSGALPDTHAVPDASRISPPVLLPGFPNPVDLGITADIDPAGFVLKEIRSSLHAVEQHAAGDGHTTVRILPGERLDRDLILRLVLADAGQPGSSLVLCSDEGDDAEEPALDLGGGTFMLTLVPPATPGSRTARDVVIVLDRSGSMGGWKMVAARRAAARIVDTLGSDDRFAVLAFDTTIEQPADLGDALVAGTDRNRFRAVEFLARLDARGGTEMLQPLELATGLLARGESARQRVLVLVTDGQVGNEDQILARLSPRLAGARVHVVGIDQAVNAGFLTRLAAVGRGRCELVESQDRLDDAAARIHQRIMAPLVTELTVSSDELTIIDSAISPSRAPDLFSGAPVTISGRFAGTCPPQATFTVRGTGADGTPYEQALAGRAVGGGPTRALWARAYVRDLEDSYSCLTSTSAAEFERLEKEIVATSLRFGVLCRFTAFCAVDTRVVTEGGVPHRVTQPVELPAGWEMEPIASVPGQYARAWVASGPASGAVMDASAARAQPLFATARQSMAQPAPMMHTAPAESIGGLIADELEWLDRLPNEPSTEMAHELADLGSRLEALATWLDGYPVAPGRLKRLRDLGARLRHIAAGSATGPGDEAVELPGFPISELVKLRDLARRILRELLDELRPGERGKEPHGGPPVKDRAFWKRSGRTA